MSTIKSQTEHLTLNADGSGKEIKFQCNGTEVAKIDSTGFVGAGATELGELSDATTTGSSNVGLGARTFTGHTTGYQNTAVGVDASKDNSYGNFNAAFGYYALKANAGNSYNTAIGSNSLKNAGQGSGNSNTALGYNAGNNITTGSTNIIIGANVTAPSATDSNQLNIGDWIKGEDGVITMPYQPAFIAYDPSGGQRSSSGLFSDEFTTTMANTGNHYSTSTGYFTAPVAGYYKFGWNLFSTTSGTTGSRAGIWYNGSNGGMGFSSGSSIASTAMGSILMYMNVGDTAALGTQASSYLAYWYGASQHNRFWGYLVG